jgi:hypothetical protein
MYSRKPGSASLDPCQMLGNRSAEQMRNQVEVAEHRLSQLLRCARRVTRAGQREAPAEQVVPEGDACEPVVVTCPCLDSAPPGTRHHRGADRQRGGLRGRVLRPADSAQRLARARHSLRHGVAAQ